jgi:hypothetical protein
LARSDKGVLARSDKRNTLVVRGSKDSPLAVVKLASVSSTYPPAGRWAR